MSGVTVDQFVEALEKWTVVDINKAVKAIEEKFGVSAAPVAVAAAAPASGGGAAAVEEKTEFTVVLASPGPNKIQVIKAVKDLLGLGLKESKDVVESAPKPIKENVDKKTADELKAKLSAAGATVEIK